MKRDENEIMLMVLKQLVRDSQNLESVRDSSTIGEKQKARASRSQNDEMDVENSSISITGGNSVLELPEASFIERVCHFYKTTLFPTRTACARYIQVQRQLSQAAGGATVGEQAARNAASRFFNSKLFSAQSAFRRDERSGVIRARLF